jgi:hypothetical protein
VVLSHKRGQRFVVDGQQRLTMLTLPQGRALNRYLMKTTP